MNNKIYDMNIPCSISQLCETIETLTELLCNKTTSYQNKWSAANANTVTTYYMYES